MKKTVLLAILTSAVALAQVVPISVPGVGETALNATFSTAAVQGLAAQISSAPASGLWPNSPAAVPQSTTLTAAITTTTATTATLASAVNIQPCNGLLIGTEVMLVTGVGPLVLQRGMAGTTAATYASGTPLTVLRTGGYTCQLKAMWYDAMNSIMVAKLNASANSASQAALAAQQAANAALGAVSVQ